MSPKARYSLVALLIAAAFIAGAAVGWIAKPERVSAQGGPPPSEGGVSPAFDWITAGTAFAGFVTALAALAAVVEMKRQRRSMYRPDMAVLPCPIHMKLESAVEGWTRNTPPEPDSTDVFTQVMLTVANVGLGSGKLLTAEWAWDIAEFERLIQRYDKDFHVTASSTQITIDYSNKVRVLYNCAFDRQEIAYVAPIAVQTTPAQISVPGAYLDLCEALFYLMLKSENATHSYDSIPPLRLMLQYQDIADETMHQQYRLAFSVYVIVIPPGNSGYYTVKGRMVPARLS